MENKKAIMKYMKKIRKNLIPYEKCKKLEIWTHAAELGESLTSFINKDINEKIERNKQKSPE